MITMTTTVFKKASLALIGLACATGIVLSVGLSHKDDTAVRAATTETKRAWVDIGDVSSWWFNDSATFRIHYFGGGVDSSAEVLLDQANTTNNSNRPTYYFDIPVAATNVQWYRQLSGSSANWTETPAYGSGLFYIHNYTGDEGKQDVGYSGYSFTTTTIVSNFAITIDTKTEACNATNAEAAVNYYNTMSTFEQDQFDILSVGGTPGLQLLTYLRSYYHITTALNINNIGDDSDSNDSLMTMLIVGAIGLTTLGGYYIISRKKHLA